MKPLGKGDKAGETKVEEEQTAPAVETAPPQRPIDFSNVKIEPLFEEFVDFETFSKSDFCAVKVKDCTAVPKSKKTAEICTG